MSFKSKLNLAWKLKEESLVDYNRFLDFRDRVPRISLEKYAYEIGLQPNRIYTLSSKYKWTERIQEFDLQNEQELQKNNRHLANEIRLNQIKTYKILQEKILNRLSNLDETQLSAGQISMLLKNLDVIESKLQNLDNKEGNGKSDELLNGLANLIGKT